MAPLGAKRSTGSLIAVVLLVPAALLIVYGGWMFLRVEPQSMLDEAEEIFPQHRRSKWTQRSSSSSDRLDAPPVTFPDRVLQSSSSVSRFGTSQQQQQQFKRCNEGSDYHEWFVKVLYDNFGRVVAEAVYDPELFNVMVNTLEDRGGDIYKWPHDDDYVIRDINEHPSNPSTFDSAPKMLWWTKRWTSVALSKISRDAELQRLFERLCADPAHEVKMRLLEKTTVQAIGAQVQYFFTVMQLIVDAMLSKETRNIFTPLVKEHQGMDVLVLLSGTITSETSLGEVERMMQSTVSVADVVRKRLNSVQHEPVKNSQSLFPLRYDDLPYDKSMPYNGKFWTMLRPTAGCSSLIRICENAEGCRLLCNAEYILYAGRRGSRKDAPSVGESPPLSQTTTPYHHRIMGMGCNNEYDWELSFLALFSGTAALSKEKAHQIGWITSMDCTITIHPGNRQWKVPQALQNAPIGYTGASLCGGARNGGNEIGPKGLKSLQRNIESTWGESAAKDLPIVRFKANPDALLAAHSSKKEEEVMTFKMSLRRGAFGRDLVSPRWFDALTMFKVDIEGSEWKYIPAWIRGELHNIRTHAPANTFAKGSTEAIDYATAAPDFFTVSLFSLEFHRIGMGEPPGYTTASALRAHWLSLQTYALGFIMVAHEKNEWGHCCYENTYIHVRHFIKSEMWMALRDDL